MPQRKNDVLPGTLARRVLETLASNPRMHGDAITTDRRHRSADLLRGEDGSLSPALRRMEQQEWLRPEWGLTEQNREARCYAIAGKRRTQLAAEQEIRARPTEGVGRMLRYA
jgi:PadR family transcriptional regulator, regulatory protein PadR